MNDNKFDKTYLPRFGKVNEDLDTFTFDKESYDEINEHIKYLFTSSYMLYNYCADRGIMYDELFEVLPSIKDVMEKADKLYCIFQKVDDYIIMDEIVPK